MTGVLGCTVATVCFFSVVVAASACIVGCKLLPLHWLCFIFRWPLLIGGCCWFLLVGCWVGALSVACCWVVPVVLRCWLVCTFALGLFMRWGLGSGPDSASKGAVDTSAAALLRTIGFLAQWPLACRIRSDHQMSPCPCSPWSIVTGVLGCTVATVCFFAVVVAASVCIVGCKLLPLHCDLFSDGGC